MLDQFYTKPELAFDYTAEILARWKCADVLFVEPAAGTGAFVRPLLKAKRKTRAIDIQPKTKNINKSDFLQNKDIFNGNHSAIVVIGNPPFGKNASLAVQFFNRAADKADEIAFIVPRTFRKLSLQKRLHENFHLYKDIDVANDAFIKNGNLHHVPCAWQIWQRRDYIRKMPNTPCVSHLINYTTANKANFAMRRVGFYAGKILTTSIDSLSSNTHYFMHEVQSGVIDVLKKIDWTTITKQTAGVRSLSKTEIAFKLSEAYGN